MIAQGNKEAIENMVSEHDSIITKEAFKLAQELNAYGSTGKIKIILSVSKESSYSKEEMLIERNFECSF